jgi:prepilin-type processing-associated H-X9-DG protein
MKKQIDGIEAEIRRDRPDSFVSRLLVPLIESVIRSQSTAVARHRAAQVLLAATRERLATGSLPESIDALVPARLPSVPRDPFTTAAPPNWSFPTAGGACCPGGAHDWGNGIIPARSEHTGGVNAVMGDGSVKFMRNSIDLVTWQRLGARNDRGVLGEY